MDASRDGVAVRMDFRYVTGNLGWFTITHYVRTTVRRRKRKRTIPSPSRRGKEEEEGMEECEKTPSFEDVA
ncbi:hypothetical protein M0804_001866 [Polistes exclamans]|nr:hypothetical protein M0804_001866 [Polistes exclamans]